MTILFCSKIQEKSGEWFAARASYSINEAKHENERGKILCP